MEALFRGMDQATLDAAYNNPAAVAGVADLLADFIQRSNALYLNHTCQRNLPYGPGPAQRFDWFPAANPTAPLVIFLLKRRSSAYTRRHAAQALDLAITTLLYSICALILEIGRAHV